MKPYESPAGSVWDFEGELFVVLAEFMDENTPNGYRRYFSLDAGRLCWMGDNSIRDNASEPVA